MTLLIIILCATIAVSGGFVVGVFVGRVDERVRAERRRPLETHEAARLVVTQLRGPLPGCRR